MARGFLHAATGTRPAATPGRARARALGICLAPLLFAATAAPAMAPLPCEVHEDGMEVGNQRIWPGTGITIEDYRVIHDHGSDHHAAPQLAAPVAALDGFAGARVTHCASGRFVVIPGVGAESVAAALADVLSAEIAAKRRISVGKMKQAAQAVYGQVQELRETEETCGCNFYFHELRPKGMTRWDKRRDQDQ